jgi:hypothetical protein
MDDRILFIVSKLTAEAVKSIFLLSFESFILIGVGTGEGKWTFSYSKTISSAKNLSQF